MSYKYISNTEGNTAEAKPMLLAAAQSWRPPSRGDPCVVCGLSHHCPVFLLSLLSHYAIGKELRS